MKTKERLYLTNSRDIVNLIQEFDMLDKYPQLKDVATTSSLAGVVTGMLGKLGSKLKSKAEQSEERVLENEKSMRQQRVRQIIDEYTDNNQMPLYKINSSRTHKNEDEDSASSINKSFKGARGAK